MDPHERPVRRTTVPGDRLTQSRGDRQRHAILAAIDRLLGQVDIAELTVGRITKEAGITRSGFYFYFDSKYTALAVALDDAWQDLAESTEAFAPRAAEESVADYAAGMIDRTAQVWRRHEPLIVAFVQAKNTDARLGLLWDGWMDAVANRVARLIEDERERGNAHPATTDVAALVRTLIAMSVTALYECSLRAADDTDWTRATGTVAAVWVAAAWGAHQPSHSTHTP